MELSLDFSSIWTIIIFAAILLVILIVIIIICMRCSCVDKEINPELREPTLQWNDPTNIVYGEALSEKQLNAVCTQLKNPPSILERCFKWFHSTKNSATIEGTCTYTPRVGTVLEAGQHTLSVHFIPHPKYKRAFSSAIRSVSITVQKSAADYSIKWNIPNMSFGKKLISAEHLNATCLLNKIHDNSIRSTNRNTPEVVEAQSSCGCFRSTHIEKGALPYISNENRDDDDLEEYRSGILAGAFVYDPPAGTLLTAGKHTLTVQFIPTSKRRYNNYLPLEHKLDIEVSPHTPKIHWPCTSKIFYGQPLNFTDHLNASCEPLQLYPSDLESAESIDIPGRFEYDPPEGTKLDAGSHELQVHFIPDDLANFTQTKVNTTLIVEKSPYTFVWNNPENIVFGTRLSEKELNAVVDNIEGEYIYDPPLGSLLSPAGVEHTLRCTFVPTDAANFASIPLSVTVFVEKYLPLLVWEDPSTLTWGTPLRKEHLNAKIVFGVEDVVEEHDAITNGDYQYNYPVGEILEPGLHDLTVTFIPKNEDNYCSVSRKVTVQVNKIQIQLDWMPPTDILYLTKLSSAQLNASISPAGIPGDYSYTPGAGELLTVGTHTLQANFQPSDSEHYIGTSSTTTLSVLKVSPKIVCMMGAPLVYGDLLSENHVSVSIDSIDGFFINGRWEYSPVLGTALNAGEHVVDVSFYPSDSTNFDSAKTTVTLEVQKVVPLITWQSPTPVSFGTRLSDLHLNAKCLEERISGDYTYEPALDTQLPPGEHRLDVTFRPHSDYLANYDQSTAFVNLTIRKYSPSMSWEAPKPINYRDPLSDEQLNASISEVEINGTIEYVPATGTCLHAGSHILTARFIPLDNTGYEDISLTVPLQVLPLVPVVEWPFPESKLKAFDRIPKEVYNAYCVDPTIEGVFTYEPVDLEETILLAGTHQMRVVFTPCDEANYSPAQKTWTFEVEPIEVLVVWEPQELIILGEKVTVEAHLNASLENSTIEGTFTYNYNDGDVLDIGLHELKVVFEPKDKKNYKTFTKSYSVKVEKYSVPLLWEPLLHFSYGTPLSLEDHLNAVSLNASVEGELKYTHSVGTILDAGSHEITATFDPVDSERYSGTKVTKVLQIEALEPTVIWNQNCKLLLTYGDVISESELLAMISSADVEGTVDFDRSFLNKQLPTGEYFIELIFSPNLFPNIKRAVQMVCVLISKAIPSVKWEIPTVISYGDLIYGPQFHASSNQAIPGSFSYSIRKETDEKLTERFLDQPVPPISTFQKALLPMPQDGTDEESTRKSEVINDAHSASVEVVKTAGSTLNADDDSLTDNSVLSLPGDGPTDGIHGAEQSLSEEKPSSYWSFKDFTEPLKLPAGSYSFSMTFVPDDIVNYESVEKNLPLKILQIKLSLVGRNDVDLEFGMLLTQEMLELLVANGEGVSGKYSFQPSSSIGLDNPFSDFIPVGQHSMDILFEPEDTLNYAVAKANVGINVSPSNYTLETSENITIQFGTTLSESNFQAKCTKSYLVGTISFSISKSNHPDFVQVCPFGISLPAGKYSVLVRFQPSDKRIEVVEKYVDVFVSKYAYRISAIEEAITISYGTAATEELLQLSCLDEGVPGQFVLKVGDSVITESVLSVGSYDVVAIYQPVDPDNFEVVHSIVSLTVLPRSLDFTCVTTLTMDYGQVVDLDMLQVSCLFSDVEGRFALYTAEGGLDPFVDYLPTGQHSLRLEYQPIELENFIVYSKEIVVEVQKYVASFYCTKSLDIEYGTKLSPTLLDVRLLSRDVSGHFEYTCNTSDKCNPLEDVLSIGQHTITISYRPPDDQNYVSAQDTVTVNVRQHAIAMSCVEKLEITYGTMLNEDMFGLEFSDDKIEGKLNYSCDTVDESEIFHSLLSVGQYEVTLSFLPADSLNYCSIERKISVTVHPKVAIISAVDSLSIVYGEEITEGQLEVTLLSDDVDGKFEFSTDCEQCVNVFTDLLPTGNHVITVRFVTPDQVNYVSATKNIPVSVRLYAYDISCIEGFNLKYGDKLTTAMLQAVCLDDIVKGEFKYTCDNIETNVDEWLLPSGDHCLEVIYQPVNRIMYSVITKQVNVVVVPVLAEMICNEGVDILYGTLLTGQLIELSCVEEKIDGVFVWTSDYEKCLNPLEDLLPPGDHVVTITFQPSDKLNYISASQVLRVSVKKFPLLIDCIQSLDFTYGFIFTEEALQIKCVQGSVEGVFEYYQDDGEMIEVHGVVFNTGQYKLRVVYVPKESSYYIPAEKVVSFSVHKFESRIQCVDSLDIIFGTTLSTELMNLDIKDMDGTFEYTCDTIDTSPIGVILLAGHYNITVNFFPTDSANFSAAEKSVVVTVTPYIADITCIDQLQISYGTIVTPELLEVRLVTDDIKGEYSYTSDCLDCPNPVVGLLPAGNHLITITFQTPDSINYCPAQRHVKILVDPYSYEISCIESLGFVYGLIITEDILQLRCLDESVDGSFELSCDTAKNNSLIEPLRTGLHIVKATYCPADPRNFITVEKIIQVTVRQQVPVIYCRETVRIVFGTKLSVEMLEVNVVAECDGTLQYSCSCESYPNPFDDLLPAGDYELTVNFVTPEDGNYLSAHRQVTVIVAKYTFEISCIESLRLCYGNSISEDMLEAKCLDDSVQGNFKFSCEIENIDPIREFLPTGQHTIRVHFETGDSKNYESVDQFVSVIVDHYAVIISCVDSLEITYSTLLTVEMFQSQLLSGDVDGKFLYSSNCKRCADLFNDLLPAGTHKVTVKFQTADRVNYISSQREVNVVVNPYVYQLSCVDYVELDFGIPLTEDMLEAKCSDNNVEGVFKYTCESSVQPIGSILQAGKHMISVDFVPNLSENFAVAKSKAVVFVRQNVTEIFCLDEVGILYGQLLTPELLNVKLLSSKIEGKFAYSSSFGDPTETFLPAGEHTISVMYIPPDSVNYTMAQRTVFITVDAFALDISCVEVIELTYGHMVTEDMIQATCLNPGVNGSFTFSCDNSTVRVFSDLLPAGRYYLAVSFIPDNPSNYIVEKKTVTVIVNPYIAQISALKALEIVYRTVLTPELLGVQFLSEKIEGGFVFTSNCPGCQNIFEDLLPVGKHVVTVDYKAPDTINYIVEKLQVVVNVSQYSLYVSAIVSLQISYGTSLTVEMVQVQSMDNSIGGKFEFKISNSQLDPFEGVLAAGEYSLDIRFIPVDTLNYTIPEKVTSIIVQKYTPTISAVEELNISYGSILSEELLAVKLLDENMEGSFSYSCDCESCLHPLRELLPAGQYSIVVTFNTPDTANFVQAQRIIRVNVSKYDYEISCLSAIEFSYGAEFTEETVQACCLDDTVIGNFQYSCQGFEQMVGQKLPVGKWSVRMAFVPQDLINFAVEEKEVTVLVHPYVTRMSCVESLEMMYRTKLTFGLLGVQLLSETVDGRFVITSDCSSCVDPLENDLPVGLHTIVVAYQTPDEINYIPAQLSVTVTVTKYTYDISCKHSLGFVYGVCLSNEILQAKCLDSSVDGDFEYAVESTGRTLEGNEVLPVGQHYIRVFYRPSDEFNYQSPFRTVSITIRHYVTVMSCAESLDITYGKLLTPEVLQVQLLSEDVGGVFCFISDCERCKNPIENLLPVGTWTLSVTYQIPDNVNFISAARFVRVTVRQYQYDIFSVPSLSFVYGVVVSNELLQLKCLDVSVDGEFEFHCNSVSYPPVGDRNLPAGQHVIHIVFRPADPENFITVEKMVYITVHPYIFGIHCIEALTITYRDILTAELLELQCLDSYVQGSFVFHCNASDDPVGGVLPVGNHSITVRFQPNDEHNFVPVEKVTSITVNQYVYDIHYCPKLDIVYGTVLTHELLELRCEDESVEGEFLLTSSSVVNPFKDLLPSNYHEVELTFQPLDTGNYITVQKKIFIQVDKYKFDIHCEECLDIVYGTFITKDLLQLRCLDSFVEGEFVISCDSVRDPLSELLTAGQHTVEVVFQPSDLENFVPVRRLVSVNVQKYTFKISCVNALEIQFRTKIDEAMIDAKCLDETVVGEFLYSYSTSLNPLSKVLDAGEYAITVRFQPQDPENFIFVEKIIPVTIFQYTYEVHCVSHLEFTYSAVVSTELLQLQLLDESVEGEFVFICESSSRPLEDPLPSGQHKLVVQYRPSDLANYIVVEKQVSIDIDKYRFDVYCVSGIRFTYGKLLSEQLLQLQCMDSFVQGHFVVSCETCSDPLSELMHAGDHTVRVLFQPSDGENFVAVEKIVDVVVDEYTFAISCVDSLDITYGTTISMEMLETVLLDNYVVGSFVVTCNTWDEGTPIGVVLPAGEYTFVVAFQPDDPFNFVPVEKNVSIFVRRYTFGISNKDQLEVVYGTPISEDMFEAVCLDRNVRGKFVYKCQNCASNLFGVLPAGVYSVTVRFELEDPVNYVEVERQATVIVHHYRFDFYCRQSLDIIYGTVLTTTLLEVKLLDDKVPGGFLYTSESSIKPLVEFLNAGSHVVQILYQPRDPVNYVPVKKDVVITVHQYTPSFKCVGSLSIVYGTLVSTQLLEFENEEKSISGEFVFSCSVPELNPLEDLLPAGNSHVISILFSTHDKVNYVQVKKDIIVEVQRFRPVVSCLFDVTIMYRTILTADTLQVCCHTPISGGQFIYHCSSSIAPLDAILSAGRHEVIVVYEPPNTDNFERVEHVAAVVIQKYMYDIQSVPTLDIVYETMITPEMLEVELLDTTVDGRFVYSSSSVPCSPVIEGNEIYYVPAGEHRICVSFVPQDTDNYVTVVKYVSVLVRQKLPEVTFVESIDFTYQTQLSNDMIGFQSSVEGSVKFDPPLLLGLDLYPAGEYLITVTFFPNDLHNYLVVEKKLHLVVRKVLSLLTWQQSREVTYSRFRAHEVLDAILSHPPRASDTTSYAATIGEYIYKPSSSEILGLSVGEHTLKVTFIPENSNYEEAEASTQLSIIPATPLIEWPQPAPFSYGYILDNIVLNATCLEDIAGCFHYSPPHGTLLDAGEHLLSLSFEPSDSVNFLPVRSTVVIKIEKVFPFLRWSIPANIEFGSILTTAQLTAEVVDTSITGVFVFTPPLGTLLEVGPQQSLLATFIPSSSNYERSEISTNITVERRRPKLVWTTPADLTWPTPLEEHMLSAQCTDQEIVGMFEYLPPVDTVLDPGTWPLIVEFRPSDTNHFCEAKLNVNANVLKCPINILWDEPADLTFGKELTAIQLNARLGFHQRVPEGLFTYTPPLSTILTGGQHTLTVAFDPADSEHFLSASVTTSIIILPAVPDLVWPTPANIIYETELSSKQLCAKTVDEAVTGVFQYEPDLGTVLPVGTHQVRATFYPENTRDYSPTHSTVEVVVEKCVPALVWNSHKIRALTYGEPLTAQDHLSATFANPNLAGKFKYFPVVDTILPPGEHWIRVVAAPFDRINYAPAHKQVRITVKKFKPTVRWEKKMLTYPSRISRQELDARCERVDIKGKFTFNPPLGSVLPGGSHILAARFDPADSDKFDTAVITTTLEVNRCDPAIQWQPQGPGVSEDEEGVVRFSYGVPLSPDNLLNVHSNVGGSFEYSHEAGQLLPIGSHVLQAVFKPNEPVNYNEAQASVTIHVVKTLPSLVFPPPEPIYYGEPLSDKQLNARIELIVGALEIPGRFEYSPPLGVVLLVGEHNLTVKFIPAQPENFEETEMSSTLFVQKFIPRIIWSDPPTMAYDSNGLSKTLLNAYVEHGFPGKIDYDPPEGSVLMPGRYTLTAKFEPEDLSNFECVSLSVGIHIEKIRPVLEWEPPKSLIVVAEKMPPMEFFNAMCKDSIKGKFEYTYKYVPREQREELLGEHDISVLAHSGMQHSDKYKYDCAITVVYQPDPKYSKIYSTVSKTLLLPTIGEVVKAAPDLYPRDRVITMYPYGAKNYADEFTNNKQT